MWTVFRSYFGGNGDERENRTGDRERSHFPSDLKNKVHFPLALQWDPLKKH